MAMTAQQLSQAIMMGNDVALQWYYATHPASRPTQAGQVIVGTQPGGGTGISFGAGTMVLAVLAIGAAIYLMKD